MSDILIGVHGFNPEGSFGSREPEVIWRDRLEKALRLANAQKKHGNSSLILISGGVESKGKTESEYMLDYAREEVPKLVEEFEVRIEERSKDGVENVEEMFKVAEDENITTVFSVTSPDHLPRIETIWQKEVEADIDSFAVSSSKTTIRNPGYYLIYMVLLMISGEYKYYF